MTTFSHIMILYNPHSTGNSEDNAKEYAHKLRRAMPASTVIETIATKYATHAETLAKEYAQAHRDCLIISSSGDGGYNEVVNGVMASGSHTAVTGLLPSGNANDHFTSLHSGNTVTATATHTVRTIDLLKVTGISHGKRVTRYAHSYASIGLAPYIGKELTKAKLNRFNEKWLVFKHFFRASPAKIRVNGRNYSYEHLVFSNIDKMSKVLQLAENNHIDDGKFEISGVTSNTAFGVLRYFAKAATTGLTDDTSRKTFSFTCRRSTPIQLDGEVMTFDRNSRVTVASVPKALHCII